MKRAPSKDNWTIKAIGMDWVGFWWIETQDATTLDLQGNIMIILAMAIRFGPELRSEGTWDVVVRNVQGAQNMLLHWLAKAENMKHSDKQRATATADEAHKIAFRTLGVQRWSCG